MKLIAKTGIAKKLLEGEDHIMLNKNDLAPINNVLLWCRETNNDFMTNFELKPSWLQDGVHIID
tara:strand:+ start:2780 stop:2971 length:192 start_codon:yes stop_codon:yes gene_type:complete